MINKCQNWHQKILHEIVPVYDEETGELLYTIYIYWHYLYNILFDNNKKKNNFMRKFWEEEERR